MIFLAILIVLLGPLAVWAFFIEPFRYQFRKYHFKIKKPLSKSFRILHLSDIHFCRVIPQLTRLFDLLSSKTYDFVFITGDIMDHENGIAHTVDCLKKIKSRFGIYAVFGNHDYLDYAFWDMLLHNFSGQKLPVKPHRDHLLKEALDGIGVKVLKNETIELDCDGQAVLIHGLDDPTTGKANVRMAMQNFYADKLNLLLTHTIDAFMDIGEKEIDASFSGHSHGGQICFPWFGPLITHTSIGKTYAGGMNHLKGAICSVSRGVGTSRNLRLRFLCPPEAVFVTLSGEGQTDEEIEKIVW